MAGMDGMSDLLSEAVKKGSQGIRTSWKGASRAYRAEQKAERGVGDWLWNGPLDLKSTYTMGGSHGRPVRQQPESGMPFTAPQPGVIEELLSPITRFAKNRNTENAVGIAAMFPWGIKGTGNFPKEWDIHPQGDQLGYVKGGMSRLGAGERLNLTALFPHGEKYRDSNHPDREIGMSDTTFYRDATKVDYVDTDLLREASLDHGVDLRKVNNLALINSLLAPAINRWKTERIPIEAHIVNPKLGKLALKLQQKNPGMFTKDTIKYAARKSRSQELAQMEQLRQAILRYNESRGTPRGSP